MVGEHSIRSKERANNVAIVNRSFIGIGLGLAKARDNSRTWKEYLKSHVNTFAFYIHCFTFYIPTSVGNKPQNVKRTMQKGLKATKTQPEQTFPSANPSPAST